MAIQIHPTYDIEECLALIFVFFRSLVPPFYGLEMQATSSSDILLSQSEIEEHIYILCVFSVPYVFQPWLQPLLSAVDHDFKR